jgi:hypothetical protein
LDWQRYLLALDCYRRPPPTANSLPAARYDPAQVVRAFEHTCLGCLHFFLFFSFFSSPSFCVYLRERSAGKAAPAPAPSPLPASSRAKQTLPPDVHQRLWRQAQVSAGQGATKSEIMAKYGPSRDTWLRSNPEPAAPGVASANLFGAMSSDRFVAPSAKDAPRTNAPSTPVVGRPSYLAAFTSSPAASSGHFPVVVRPPAGIQWAELNCWLVCDSLSFVCDCLGVLGLVDVFIRVHGACMLMNPILAVVDVVVWFTRTS